MKTKPDDRRNNVDRIQHTIDNTIENFRLAEESIEESDDENYKEVLEEKNHRREESLDSLKTEIRDEAIDKKKGYR
jgi:small acid-soluble spore protein (thioredoxin-like protein)